MYPYFVVWSAVLRVVRVTVSPPANHGRGLVDCYKGVCMRLFVRIFVRIFVYYRFLGPVLGSLGGESKSERIAKCGWLRRAYDTRETRFCRLWLCCRASAHDSSSFAVDPSEIQELCRNHLKLVSQMVLLFFL